MFASFTPTIKRLARPALFSRHPFATLVLHFRPSLSYTLLTDTLIIQYFLPSGITFALFAHTNLFHLSIYSPLLILKSPMRVNCNYHLITLNNKFSSSVTYLAIDQSDVHTRSVENIFKNCQETLIPDGELININECIATSARIVRKIASDWRRILSKLNTIVAALSLYVHLEL